MSRRRLFSLLNTIVLVAALAIWFLLPQYAVYALYAIAAWIAVGFGLTWSTLRSPASAPSAPTAAPGAFGGSAAPAALARGSTDLTTIDFCVYCGAYYAPEERRCAACGHALPAHAVPA